MPVQFTCQHCASSLSVSSRKAGERVTCPKCRLTTLVPVREISSVLAAEVMSQASPAPKPVAQTAVAKPDAAVRPLPDAQRPTTAVEASASAAQADTTSPAGPNKVPVAAESAPKVPVAPPEPPDPPEIVYLPLSDSAADEVTWVYEDDAPKIDTDPHRLAVDFDKLALPRYVLYGQGVLLGVVALVALTLGILIGRSSAPRGEVARGPAKPCYLTGKVTYISSSGAKLPDVGAVVMVVPQDHRPEQKLAIEGLRPDDPEPSEDLAAMGQLSAIGGDYARVNTQGSFKLRVPDTGEYFLLVVSKHGTRRSSERLDSVDLAQMGRYFLPALDLIGDRRYRWQAESIQRDRDFNLALD